MLPLILGISLGIILLFVVVLLVTEMAATYPVWKQFDRERLPHSGQYILQPTIRQKRLKILLLALVCLLALFAIFVLVRNPAEKSGSEAVVEARTEAGTLPLPAGKFLTDSLAEQGVLVTLLAKWQDEKIYCNTRILFQQAPAASEWQISLLDKEGFVIKEFRFTAADFVAEVQPGGAITALLNRSNAPLSQKEYQRIVKLQVVLDKKLPRQAGAGER